MERNVSYLLVAILCKTIRNAKIFVRGMFVPLYFILTQVERWQGPGAILVFFNKGTHFDRKVFLKEIQIYLNFFISDQIPTFNFEGSGRLLNERRIRNLWLAFPTPVFVVSQANNRE